MSNRDDAIPEADQALDRLRRELARPPFHAVLQPRAESVDPETGSVTVVLPFRPELGRSPDDLGIHGGVLASLVDITAHAAVALRSGAMAPTVDLRIDFLRPAEGELRATGRVLRHGRSLASADVEVTDGRGKLVAVGRGTFSTARTAS